jgi:hypothetical protein
VTSPSNTVYRLVIVAGGRGRLFEDAPYASYEHAQARVSAAVESAGAPLQEIELQRGTPVSPCVFDPYRIIPGERGGWSNVRWASMRRWDKSVVDRIARQADLRSQLRPRRERVWVYSLSVVALMLAAATVFLLQTGGRPAVLLADGQGIESGRIDALPRAAHAPHPVDALLGVSRAASGFEPATPPAGRPAAGAEFPPGDPLRTPAAKMTRPSGS